jgi:hypothetical protein
MADWTGASKRIVECLRGVYDSVAKSQTMTFQSFDDVKTYREFLDQLSEGIPRPYATPSMQLRNEFQAYLPTKRIRTQHW